MSIQNHVLSPIRFQRRESTVRYQHIIRQSKRASEAFRAFERYVDGSIERRFLFRFIRTVCDTAVQGGERSKTVS